jgi:putative ABC transport system permease protein
MMLRVTLAGLRAHKFRLVATALAIVLGVGFVAGTLIFGDTAKAALFDQFARAAQNVDAAVLPPQPKGESDRPELPPTTVDEVRATPGVGAVEGRMRQDLPLLDSRGKLVGNGDNPGVTISAGTEPRLRPYDVVAGRAPAALGEAALDVDTGARTRYRLGDPITVLDSHQGRHTLTLVGTVSFGTSKQYANQAVVVLTPADITSLTGGTGFQEVVATATGGVSQSELSRRIATALPAGTPVRTGADYRFELANAAIGQLDPFLTVLLIFAGIACVVSAFVIYNTFNVLIAQRIREMALLRCVGASRAQIFRSVLVESLVIGALGSVLGIGLGLATGYGLFSGADALGAPLPGHALVLTVPPILVALLIGVVVTMISAVLPAIRSTRVAPLAALRATPLATVTGVRRRQLLIVVAALTAALGTGLTVLGSRQHDDPKQATMLVVAGGVINFLAVLVVSPLFVGPLTAALGWLPGRVFGTPAKLAVANARRNPGRAAATTAALMIGIGLMAAATVAVDTVRQTADHQLTANYPIDYLLRPQGTGDRHVGVPVEVATRLRQQGRLSLIAEVRTGQGSLDGIRTSVGTFDDSAAATLLRPQLTAGSMDRFGAGAAVLFTDGTAAKGRNVGDRITVTADGGHRATFTVVGFAGGSSQTGDVMVGWSDFAALYPKANGDDMVMAKAGDGVAPVDSRAAVESVTDGYPLVSVMSVADWRAQVTDAVGQLLTVIAALLAVAIVIALIGIMNTLSLSVLERTRESAVVRALGLTRTQLRVTLLMEALLMGVVGAVVGIAFGVLYGWATSRVMFAGIKPILTVPVGELLGYAALAAVAAVLAAVLPARRAAKASVVAAMAEV